MLEFCVLVCMAASLIGAAVAIKASGQRRIDAVRIVYDVVFPHEMDQKQVEEFIRSIGKNLRGGAALGGLPTVVFETWASSAGIKHKLRLPRNSATYLLDQIRGAIAGIDVKQVGIDLTTDDEMLSERTSNKNLQVVDNHFVADYKQVGFQYGATLHMRNGAEELPINSVLGFSDRVIRSFRDAADEHDTVVVQWVIAHSNNQKQPPSDKPIQTQRSGMVFNLIFGPSNAGRDEVKTRQLKQQDQNYIATGRVAARGSTIPRAVQLVSQVVRAYTSEGGHAFFYAKGANPQDISHDIHAARTPLRMTAQLSVGELAAVIGWPMSKAYIPGLERGSMQHMPASQAVPIQGRILGESTMPNSNRPIAMSYLKSLTHTFIGGGTETGKTTLMVNMIIQDINAGMGVFLLEREGNLFNRVLNHIPPDRMDDVICIDLSRPGKPLGLNLLRTNKPEVVAGQLATLLDNLYPELGKGMWVNKLVRHGIPVLANLERATIADLIPLVHPKTPAEKAWARQAVEKMTDDTYRRFWQEEWYPNLDKRDQVQIAKDSQSLKNRMWELMTPEASRYLLNQETSSFDMADVILKNKILLVNLAGVPEQVASTIGAMIIGAIWAAALRNQPVKPNFLYVDEVHQFSHLSGEIKTMFATARKHQLGLTVATQYPKQLPNDVQSELSENARTKIVFQSGEESASNYSRAFGSNHVNPESFMNLKAHIALARINTDDGVSEPVTIRTFPEPDGNNQAERILARSNERYGRNVADIAKNDSTRRIAHSTPSSTQRKNIGKGYYAPKGD